MVKELQVNVKPLLKKMDLILQKLSEARIISKYRRIFKGKGLEFLEFKEYTQDEDASRIDWKATLKSNKPLMKVFKEERDLDVYILLDVSNSMIFGSTEKLKSEYAAEVVAALAHVILTTGDKAGLIMFSDSIKKVIVPMNTTYQFYTILKASINGNLYGGGFDMNLAIKYIMNLAKRESLVIIVSDFFGLKENWDESLKIAGAKFDVIGIMVRDPRDEELPKYIGKVLIKDPFSSRELLIDPDLEAEEYKKYTLEKKEEIKKSFLRNDADFIEVKTNEDLVRKLLELLERRERRFI